MPMPKFMQVDKLMWVAVVMLTAVCSVTALVADLFGQLAVMIGFLPLGAITREMELSRRNNIAIALIVGSFFSLGLLVTRSFWAAILGGIGLALCLLVVPAWDHIHQFLRRLRARLYDLTRIPHSF